MSTPPEPRPAKRSEARERLLAAASGLFYAEGIGSVGVNRIVTAGRVTLATFYRHFPTKEDLVVAYLDGVHDAIAAGAATLEDDHWGRELVRALGRDVTAQTARPGFRGCAFVNAASEFEDPGSPVRRVVAEHRRWYLDLVRRGFEQAGHRLPGNAARHFVMLRDGAMTAGSLDDPDLARRTFDRGVEGLLRSVDLEPADPREDDDA
ncbi:TetR/AcrR family transcriptional regulator [Patulibacter minatonensis]|uniref:TetR/AcrR family transcriptional regulator n=1 Tax=Patulibacter minatonensis TaxID=298163 RepID=UPI00047CD084|nr:TetR/AcrR family transcriptional regulator [Patulibacter minatonensis]